MSEDNSNALPGGRSQTRQAINNAIKRELACPTEGGKAGNRGKSSRSKTFLELFREKCRAADVAVPPLEDLDVESSLNDPPSQPPTATGPQVIAAMQSQMTSFPLVSAGMVPIDSTLVPSAFPLQQSQLPSTEMSSQGPLDLHAAYAAALKFLRSTCPETDEWGRTAWWNLAKDEDVRRLPTLLMQCSPFQLRTLLIDFRWIMRTFQCVDFSRGMRHLPTEGYDILLSAVKNRSKHFPPHDLEGFRLIRNAIMLVIPILAEDSSATCKDPSFFAHLATQLTGRLLDLKRRFPNIAELEVSIKRYAPRPWLRPLSRCFHQPKTDIKLSVPSNGPYTPHLIVLSDDGKLLVTSGTARLPKKGSELSGRKVNLIRLWDVESGKCLFENCNIRFFAHVLALSRDKSCVMFETLGGLYFWHLKCDGENISIELEVQSQLEATNVTSITPTGRPDMALTTHRRQDSSDHALISLWDTKSGSRIMIFSSVKSNANCIDVSSNGGLFASGHDNGFIHIWNLSLKQEIACNDSETKPILSFQNLCKKIGQQPVVLLEQADEEPDGERKKTISLSFHDSGEGQWVAAVSADEVIRIWELPPSNILERRTKQFVSTLCQAVIPRPRTYIAQWTKGRFYSGGDDGVACEWERCRNGDWRWFAIDKKRGERASEISTALISAGKNCDLVATYQSKSPYVTVWDMGSWRDEEWMAIRSRAYRSHCAMRSCSVDVMDIQDLTVLPTSRGGGGARASPLRGPLPLEPRMNLYGDDIRAVRQELEKYFRRLDAKMTTRTVGEMQPRLTMQVSEGSKVLEVCFDQPVTSGVSGIFLNEQSGDDWDVVARAQGDGGTMRDRRRMETEHMYGDSGSHTSLNIQTKFRMHGTRRGMAAALQDGSVTLFELEDDTGEPFALKVEKSLENVEMITSVASGTSATSKRKGDDLRMDIDSTGDDSGPGKDRAASTTGDVANQRDEESGRKKRRIIGEDVPADENSSKDVG